MASQQIAPTDVVIVGAGPGGSAAALFLAQRGIRSTLIEKDSFPRFHIGESLTGECAACLRRLGLEGLMERRSYPVKYGVKVYGPGGKNSFWVPVMRRGPDGALTDSSTWQVRRADFDRDLLEEAKARGVQVIRGQALAPLRGEDGAVTGVRIRREDGQEQVLASKVLVDASGPSAFLCNAGVTGPRQRGHYDKQLAVFSQVKGALRDPGGDAGNTLILYKELNHWAWFIPVDEERTSVGVVVPSEYYSAQGKSKRDFFAEQMHQVNEELTRRLVSAEIVDEVRAASNYSYQISNFTGKGFICIGDAHRFIDPVFSFGVYFAVREAEFAAEAISQHLAHPGQGGNPFAELEKRFDSGMDAIQTLVDGFWQQPFAFAVFAHRRYRDEFVDLFSGRVYLDEPSSGLLALRKMCQPSVNAA